MFPTSPRPPARRAVSPIRARSTLGAIVLALGLAPGLVRPAHAQVTAAEPALPSDPTLAQLIADSLSARPELAQSRALVDAAEERVPQAGALPDPMLQLGVQNDGFTSLEIGRAETSFVQVMASQTFPWPGTRELRSDVAQLGAEQAKQSVARLRLSTEADVRRGYLALILARDRLALLDALEVTWRRSLDVARIRYQSGDGAQPDVLRAQLELSRLQQRRAGLEAIERRAVQAINRLRGHPLDEAIATATHIRDLPPLDGLEARFSAERARQRSPELATARLGITRAQRSLALAENGRYPDLTVGAGIMFRGALAPMWLVTVAAPLPLFPGSKQRRAVAENRAMASAAQGEAAGLAQQVALRSEERHAAFTALRRTVELYQQGLLVQSQAASQSALAQYEVGKGSFAAVLEANAGLIADQDGFLASVAAAHQILIAEAEISVEPPPEAGAP